MSVCRNFILRSFATVGSFDQILAAVLPPSLDLNTLGISDFDRGMDCSSTSLARFDSDRNFGRGEDEGNPRRHHPCRDLIPSRATESVLLSMAMAVSHHSTMHMKNTKQAAFAIFPFCFCEFLCT
ncbi:hypothetical protein M569_16099 [Genlisea aurea]|uniref:Uncharacterized protein n=1 Tax=Genlisea aurea TaxID=192259 RepID=S8DH58_9LAMI|nr:hypothetical protein M569_16099 [Genlisea aurea]